MRIRRLVMLPLGLGILLGILVSFAQPVHAVHAQTTTTFPLFSITPFSAGSAPASIAYLVYTSGAGATIQGKVHITNVGTGAGSAALYPTDATTAQTTGIVYPDAQPPLQGVGGWLTLWTNQVTLQPRQSQDVAFTLRIPANAPIGQHVGGIVAQNLTLQHAQSSGAVQVNIQNVSIMAVQVNIPGAWTDKLVASGITAGGADSYQALDLGLSNTGNTMIKPYGTLVVQQGGKTLQDLTITMNTFLPDTSIQYPVLTQHQALGAGSYDATLDLSYGNGQHLHYTTAFTITDQQVLRVFSGLSRPLLPSSSLPWWVWLIVGACLLTAAGASAYAVIVQRRAGRKPSRSATSL